MAKVSRKMRAKNHDYYQKVVSPPVNAPAASRTRLNTPAYDANLYIKKDLKWSVLVAGLVVVIMVLLYIFLH